MEMRHKEEKEKLDHQKEQLKAYKEKLINDILESRSDFTREELKKKSIRVLEMIY